MPSTASLTWRPRKSATLCAIISPAPVAVLPPPAQGRLDRVVVLSEPGSTRARHELAIGATDEACLVGLRQSLVRNVADSNAATTFWFVLVVPCPPRDTVKWFDTMTRTGP